MTPLEDTPSHIRHISDDSDAKALFVQLGIFNELFNLSTKSSLPQARTNVALYFDHLTHWVAGCCHMGHSIPAENGYAAICFPKVTYSRAKFEDAVRSSLRSPMYFVEARKLRPSEN